MEHFCAPAHGFFEAWRAHGHDHEFLKVDAVIRVLAAVDDIHHGNREHMGADPAQILPKRQFKRLGRSLGTGKRHRQNSIGAQGCLVVRSIQLDESAIDLHLIEDVHADDFGGDGEIDVVDRFLDTLAHVAILIAVTKFHGLIGTGRRARRNSCPPDGTIHGVDLCLYGRITARIKNLSCMYGLNPKFGHIYLSSSNYNRVKQYLSCASV